MRHVHDKGHVTSVTLYASGLGQRYRVDYKCGCFGAYLVNGTSVTGGDSMKDLDAEWLAAKTQEPRP